jgi:hypothetical protein
MFVARSVQERRLVKHLMLSEEPDYSVPWRTTEYIDVAAKARELGCQVPVGIALLPCNFAVAASPAEFRYHELVPQVRQVWRRVGLVDSGPGQENRPKEPAASGSPGQSIPFAIFFGIDLPSVSERPALDALSMVASVLTTNLRLTGAQEVRVDAIVERPNSGGYVCLGYRGNVYELVTLARPIREIQDGGPNVREQEARKRKSLNKEGGAGW